MMPHKGKERGFNQRLDKDLLVRAIQNMDADFGLTDKYKAEQIREILNKPKTAAQPVPPKYRIGTKVLFRIDIDSQWKPAPRYTGRIVQRFFNKIWFYVIQDSDGHRYSLEWYKVIIQVHNELMVVPQAVSAIIKLEQPAMAGELAA